MPAFIITILVGALCIVMGVSHMKGNLSTLHSYHTHRVSEQDRPAFGKTVGLGIVLLGCAFIVWSVLCALSVLLERSVFESIGMGVLIVGIVAGLALSFGVMIKYNKGIF